VCVCARCATAVVVLSSSGSSIITTVSSSSSCLSKKQNAEIASTHVEEVEHPPGHAPRGAVKGAGGCFVGDWVHSREEESELGCISAYGSTDPACLQLLLGWDPSTPPFPAKAARKRAHSPSISLLKKPKYLVFPYSVILASHFFPSLLVTPVCVCACACGCRFVCA
jgi:hypothetical protein